MTGDRYARATVASADMTEAQYLPHEREPLYDTYLYCDVVFTIFFTLECFFNMAVSSNNTFPYVAPL